MHFRMRNEVDVEIFDTDVIEVANDDFTKLINRDLETLLNEK
jgi:hypothetical protein